MTNRELNTESIKNWICKHLGEVCIAIGGIILVALLLYILFKFNVLVGIAGLGFSLIITGAILIKD